MPLDKKSLSSQLWVSVSVNTMETWASNGPASSAAVIRLANPMYKVSGVPACVFRLNRGHLRSKLWDLRGLFLPKNLVGRLQS